MGTHLSDSECVIAGEQITINFSNAHDIFSFRLFGSNYFELTFAVTFYGAGAVQKECIANRNPDIFYENLQNVNRITLAPILADYPGRYARFGFMDFSAPITLGPESLMKCEIIENYDILRTSKTVNTCEIVINNQKLNIFDDHLFDYIFGNQIPFTVTETLEDAPIQPLKTINMGSFFLESWSTPDKLTANLKLVS
jgi:hypothetical protein